MNVGLVHARGEHTHGDAEWSVACCLTEGLAEGHVASAYGHHQRGPQQQNGYQVMGRSASGRLAGYQAGQHGGALTSLTRSASAGGLFAATQCLPRSSLMLPPPSRAASTSYSGQPRVSLSRDRGSYASTSGVHAVTLPLSVKLRCYPLHLHNHDSLVGPCSLAVQGAQVRREHTIRAGGGVCSRRCSTMMPS